MFVAPIDAFAVVRSTRQELFLDGLLAPRSWAMMRAEVFA